MDYSEARKGGAGGKAGDPGKMVIEPKEIKIGGASASMFEVPKDFRKVSSMPELMGGGGKMMEQMKKSEEFSGKGTKRKVTIAKRSPPEHPSEWVPIPPGIGTCILNEGAKRLDFR